MPNVSSPFGLKAKSHPSGVIRPQRFIVPASDVTGNLAMWNNIYQDDAIYIDSNGRIQVTGIAVNAGAGSNACVGSFQGVEYADSNGRRTVSNQFQKTWISNRSENSGLGGVTDVWFWLYLDPEITYEVQNVGSLGGQQGEGNLLYYYQNSGQNAVTGFSTGNASTTAPAIGTATGNAPFIVYNLAYDNNPQNSYAAGTPTGINTNNWTDAFPNVLVRLANPQFVPATTTGF